MKVTKWCADNFRYYVVFSKSILFILGLVFSCKLVEKALLDILITRLTDKGNDHDLRGAAIVVNLSEGTCAVAQIFFAFVADAYSGLFRMVVGSTIFYIIGLFLTYYAAPGDQGSLALGVFYPALVLVTLSQAAEMITLQSFLGDQVAARDRQTTQEEEEKARDQQTIQEEKERAQRRTKFWWMSLSFLAAIFALPLNIISFKILALVLAIAMGAAFLWFLFGVKVYNYVRPTCSALSDVVRVIHSAIIKRNVEYPQTPEQLYKNSSGLVQILPHVSWLRWLDKAAVVQGSPVHICTVEQVKGVKFLLKMLPMWSTFLTFSLVAAAGSTFFLEEATSITDETGPVLVFFYSQGFIVTIVSGISDYVLDKLGKKYNNAQRMMLVRIGIGMLCCVLCCIAAWANALHMLRAKNHMNVFWLTPQYFLLAVMEGLSAGGLENFFDSQVSRSISKYGPPFGECVIGVGKFVSVVCILILSRWCEWFQSEPKPRRLDKYYAMLAILSFVNFILYCLVARWYGDVIFPSKDEVDEELGSSELQVDSLASLESRSRSSKGQYNSNRSFSSRIVPVSEEKESSSGDNLTENTNSEQSQTPEDSSPPLLKPQRSQEITSSSSTVFPADNRHDGHETEALKADVFDSTDQVLPSVSESTMDGPSDAPLQSFQRLSSRGLFKRSTS